MKPIKSHIYQGVIAGLISLLIQPDTKLQAQSIPPPVADYTFQNTLSSNIGSGPALINIGNSSNIFATETVNSESRTVLQFPLGNGLQLSPTTGLIANDTYTIVVYFRFTELSGYRKIIDVSNGIADEALYNLDNTLRYYPQSGSSATPIQTDQYVQVVLTRDQSGTVKGYVDGTEHVSFDDTGNIAVITTANVLQFLIDDSDTNDENASGAVARIRLYDTVLTAEQIQILAPLGSTIIVGDANNDGKISILDIINTVRMAIGKDLEPANGSDAFTRADANKDGNINILDVIYTANTILGIPNKPTVLPATTATVQFDPLALDNQDGMMASVTVSSEQSVAGIQMTLAYDDAMIRLGLPELAQPGDGVTIESHIQHGRIRLIIYDATGPLNRKGPSFNILVPVELLNGRSAALTLTDVLVADRQAQPVNPVIVTSTVLIQDLPAPFKLGVAFPNPFNPQTQITYELPGQAHVTLIVYNLLGQEIIRLVDQVQNAGPYTVTWNGRNTQGASVASGVYMYRLTTDSGFQAVRRVTLVK